jgi:hypothetical protein
MRNTSSKRARTPEKIRWNKRRYDQLVQEGATLKMVWLYLENIGEQRAADRVYDRWLEKATLRQMMANQKIEASYQPRENAEVAGMVGVVGAA